MNEQRTDGETHCQPNSPPPSREQRVASDHHRLTPPLPFIGVYENLPPPYRFGLILPICQPQDRRTLTTLGVTAAVRGTRTKMKVL